MDLSAKRISKNNFYRNVAQIRILYLVSIEKEKGNERGGGKLIQLYYKLMDYIIEYF